MLEYSSFLSWIGFGVLASSTNQLSYTDKQFVIVSIQLISRESPLPRNSITLCVRRERLHVATNNLQCSSETSWLATVEMLDITTVAISLMTRCWTSVGKNASRSVFIGCDNSRVSLAVADNMCGCDGSFCSSIFFLTQFLDSSVL